jgi:hypothetical protein
MFILETTDGTLTPAITPVFAKEIQKGILFLNEVEPNWRDRIDPSTLNLASITMCVCGQVFQDHYNEGMRHLSKYLGLEEDADDDKASEYGFCVSTADVKKWRELGGGHDTESAGKFLFSALTEEWIAVLKVEQQAKDIGILLPSQKRMADLVT